MTDSTPSAPFRVLVRDLPVHRTVEVGPEYVGRILAGMPMREALGGGVEAGHGRLQVELYAEGSNVHARGRMRGQVVIACSRCVAAARIDLDEEVQVTFMPEAEIAAMGREEAGEEGVELGEEDLDVFPYDGEVVDLEPLVREQLVLAVPYAPVCREECRGLCPHCGVDRNVEACSCQRPLDPRFEALKGLKLPS